MATSLPVISAGKKLAMDAGGSGGGGGRCGCGHSRGRMGSFGYVRRNASDRGNLLLDGRRFGSGRRDFWDASHEAEVGEGDNSKWSNI